MSSLVLAQDTAPDGTVPAGLGIVGGVLVVVVLLALLLLFVAALVSILRSPNLSGGGKLLWVVIVLVLQFFGPLAWFLFGRTMRLDRTPQR